MTITKGLMTSNTEMWATPPSVFEPLNAEFGFTLDACAIETNAKVPNFFSPSQDALKQDWVGVVWMNPPYGRTIGKWMAKALSAATAGATVVCLVPARTDTNWWWDYAMKGEIRFVRGRIKFIDSDGKSGQAAPFPSAIVIFRHENIIKEGNK
jgi:phage N-6-adenine-methyltransferase